MLANISNDIKPSYSKLTYSLLNIIRSKGKPEHLGVVYIVNSVCVKLHRSLVMIEICVKQCFITLQNIFVFVSCCA